MKISIVVPIYNVEKYLERCIETLINQTYKDIEIILVNDGSTDKSAFICKSYQEKDKRIKIINKENGGLSDARNFGLNAASGEYVLFVDSDDYIELDTCEKFSKILEINENLDIVTGNANVIKNSVNEKMNHSHFASESSCTGSQYLKNELSLNCMYMAAWLNLYKVSFLRNNNLYYKKGLLHEDEELTPRIFLKANSVMHLDYCFYNYIIRENSISTSKNLSKNADHLFSTLYDLDKLYDTIEDDDLKKLLKNSLAEKYLNMFQLLKNTNSDYKKNFDKNFVKRNAYSRKNKFKSSIFSINKNLYYFLNKTEKNIAEDFSIIKLKENLFYSLMIVLSVVFLSRFFNLFTGGDNSITQSIYVWISRILCVFICFWYIKTKKVKKISSFNIFLSLFYLLIILINIFNGGELRSILSITYPIVSISLLFELSFSYNKNLTVCVLNYSLLLLIIINFSQMLFFGNVIGEHQFLLGYRNQLGILLIIQLFVCSIYCYLKNNNTLFYISYLIALFTIILAGSINNLLVIAFISIFLFKKDLVDKYISNLSMLFCLNTYLVFYFSVVVLRLQNYFSFIIESIFHRSLSLSGRTYIWDEAIKKIMSNPFLGYGKKADINYFRVRYKMSNGQIKDSSYSAHNTFLQSIYESGVLPVIFLFVFVLYFGQKILTSKLRELNTYLVFIFGILIINMVENVGFDGIFIILCLGYFYSTNSVNKKHEIEEEIS